MCHGHFLDLNIRQRCQQLLDSNCNMYYSYKLRTTIRPFHKPGTSVTLKVYNHETVSRTGSSAVSISSASLIKLSVNHHTSSHPVGHQSVLSKYKSTITCHLTVILPSYYCIISQRSYTSTLQSELCHHSLN